MSRHGPVLSITMMSLLLGWAACPAIAQDAGDPKVRVRLVADTAEVEPGSNFRVGVRFEIEDGWHIYWRYPGGAGLATAVDFELPDGLAAGPLQWPLPIAFDQSDGIPGYGYEGSVVLASEIAVAGDFDRPRPKEIRAEVSWLACKDVCVLGSAELESSLAKLTVDEVFQEWRQSLPQTLSENSLPCTLSSTGGLTAGMITHWLLWSESPRSVEWFPDPPEAIEVGEVRLQTRGGLTRIDAEVRARKGATGSTDTLPSLVVITDSGGTRQGWEVSVGLTNSEDQRRR